MIMRAIRLTTGIPGPRSRTIMHRRESVVPRGLSHATPIVAARAEGAVVEDVHGNRYIDLAGGIGAMVGIELVTDRATRAPAKEATNTLTRMAYERGVLLISAGTYGNVIRSLVPLVISDAELDEAMDVLETCLDALAP
jgi:4-aminobutyrate aminotransferase-like enzyme